jgi:hypothetical protein
VRLRHRTTRSVLVTDAGLRVLERLRTAIDQTAGALEDSAKSSSYAISKHRAAIAIGGRPISGSEGNWMVGKPPDDRSRRQLVIISERTAPFSGSFSRAVSSAPIGFPSARASGWRAPDSLPAST